MSHIIKEKNTAARCDALLEQVNGIYLEIETHYQSMQNNISATSSQQILQTVGVLNTLLQEAQSIDYLVAAAFEKASGFSASTSTLLEKRGEILSRLYQGNRNIATRARNVQSLLRHEITSLSKNHKAINGYKPSGTDRKHMIRAAF